MYSYFWSKGANFWTYLKAGEMSYFDDSSDNMGNNGDNNGDSNSDNMDDK